MATRELEKIGHPNELLVTAEILLPPEPGEGFEDALARELGHSWATIVEHIMPRLDAYQRPQFDRARAEWEAQYTAKPKSPKSPKSPTSPTSSSSSSSAPSRADAVGADEAAALLGVKKATLYVYVSRGLLRSVRAPGGNKRGYLRDDIMRLKARGDVRAGRPLSAIGALHYGEPVIESSITLIDPERGPVVRGFSAVDLALRGVVWEQMASLLWTGALPDTAPRFTSTQPRLARFKLVADAKRPLDKIEAALFMLGQELPRYAMPDERKLAEGILASVHAVVGVDDSVLLHRACVVLADHELNPSTFAARVAASTGASLIACLQAAVATFSGPRHGGACDRIEALLDEIGKPHRAREVVKARLARGDEVPGFFAGIYQGTDPRSAALLDLPEAQRAATATSRALIDAMRELGGPDAPGPSVDLALVAAGRGAGWSPGTATGVFAMARMAGWIAHVIEQRESKETLRPRARFTGGAPA